MQSNLERYKKDLKRLLAEGERLKHALARDAFESEFDEAVLKEFNGDKARAEKFCGEIPQFKMAYQPWYSEALGLIRQLLPDRTQDFIRLYEKPKGRKLVGFENYRIEDALQGLEISRNGEVLADARSAIPHFDQQLAIVRSIERRFESSLFEIAQLVQADLFDSELDGARELLKNKFVRAAGALAGVVLEKHLAQVCENHGVKLGKKHPAIADYNDALKEASVLDVPQWRFHQHLGDIRNLCDHSKTTEPSVEQVNDLITGVTKVTKTIY